jgi:uncharacterized phosphosugar-binding protein
MALSASIYINALQRMLDRIATEQIGPIAGAADIVAEAIAAGGVLQIFGSGHSHMIAEEAFYRAGGLAPVNPILDERLIFLEGAVESTEAERRPGYAENVLKREHIGPNDAALIISNSGRNAAPIEVALQMKERKLKVIAITNLQQSRESTSRHASRLRLFEIADLVIDNCTAAGDALLEISGSPHKLGPSSTVAGVAIVNCIMVETAVRLQKLGLPVPVLLSSNVEGNSDQTMAEALSPWTSKIRLFNVSGKFPQ